MVIKIQISKEDTIARKVATTNLKIVLTHPIEITRWETLQTWMFMDKLMANNKPISKFQNNLQFMLNKTKEWIPMEFNKITEFHSPVLFIAPLETWIKKVLIATLTTNLSHQLK